MTAAVEVVAAGEIAVGEEAFVLAGVASEAAGDRPEGAGIEQGAQMGMGDEAGDAAVAVEKGVDPEEAVVSGGGGEKGLGFAEAGVDSGEAFQETGDGAGADGDMVSDADVA
jgi:hypothetical protein